MLGIYTGVMSTYVLVVTTASWFRPKQQKPEKNNGKDMLPSIAVLIPAHNEEKQILAVISSILDTDYQGKYQTFVIADNCHDRTAAIARESGATVFERTDPVNPGKGQAINWALTTQSPLLAEFSIIAFVDADTEVDPNFLPAIADSLGRDDIDVVQGFHSVSNAEDNWRTSFTYLGFAGINHIRPSGQYVLGGSAGIKGNGMAFKTPTLLEMGWPARSIVEDLEISLMLLLSGKSVAYNGNAIVRSEMPQTAEQAETQRERWEGGRYQIIREYTPQLLAAYRNSGRWKYLDAWLDLALPPFTLMVLVVLLSTACGWLLSTDLALTSGMLGIAAIAFYCASALIQTNAPAKVWKNLMAAPLFLLWKIPLSLKLLGNKQKQWNRTTRNREKH